MSRNLHVGAPHKRGLPPPPLSRHSRSPDIATLTLAEWLCGAFDWLDPPGVSYHVLVFGERHLRHVLSCYIDYYNAARTHLSLDKDTPVQRAVQSIGRIQARPVLGGLHHQYARI